VRMSFRVFMRATLQGVTQMGKSRPGATALRQHALSRCPRRNLFSRVVPLLERAGRAT
jgi:hypothetical protein